MPWEACGGRAASGSLISLNSSVRCYLKRTAYTAIASSYSSAQAQWLIWNSRAGRINPTSWCAIEWNNCHFLIFFDRHRFEKIGAHSRQLRSRSDCFYCQCFTASAHPQGNPSIESGLVAVVSFTRATTGLCLSTRHHFIACQIHQHGP